MKRKTGNSAAAVQMAQLLLYWLRALLGDRVSRWALLFNIFCLIWLRPPDLNRNAQLTTAAHDEWKSAGRGRIPDWSLANAELTSGRVGQFGKLSHPAKQHCLYRKRILR